MADLKFGVLMANWDPFSHNLQLYSQAARRAEELGFESFHVTDHFMRPHAEKPVSPSADSSHEAWSLIAYLSALTRSIRLGTLVTPIPLRPPQILAKTVATVDHLSNGRVILGVGAGWGQREFEGYGRWDSSGVRVRRTREALQLIRKLWTEKVVNFQGEFYSAKGAVLEPKPLQQPHPPIWAGAIHDKMLRLTAELGDGWFPGVAVGATIEYYPGAVAKLRSYAKKTGRTRNITFGVMGWFTQAGAKAPVQVVGDLSEASAKLEAYRAAGCEYFIAVFYPVEKYIPMMETFAREIIPSFG